MDNAMQRAVLWLVRERLHQLTAPAHPIISPPLAESLMKFASLFGPAMAGSAVDKEDLRSQLNRMADILLEEATNEGAAATARAREHRELVREGEELAWNLAAAIETGKIPSGGEGHG